MFNTIQKSRLLIQSVKALTQRINTPSILQITSSFPFQSRTFSQNPNPNLLNRSIDKDGREMNMKGKASRSRFSLQTQFVRSEPVIQGWNDEEVYSIVNSEFKNNLRNSRSYLRTSNKTDVAHLRACAMMELNAGCFDEARIILKELFKSNPMNTDVLSDLCVVEREAGNLDVMFKYQRAFQRIRNRKAVMDKNPSTSRPSRLFEEEEEEANDPSPVDFDDLVYLDPREKRAVLRDHYSAAVQFAPNKLDVILNWARRELNDGYIDKAVLILREAIQVRHNLPGTGFLHLELAKYLYYLNDISNSVISMKKALEDPTAKPRAVKMLAELSEVTENESAALELFQAAVDQPNSDSQTWKYYLDYLEIISCSIFINKCVKKRG